MFVKSDWIGTRILKEMVRWQDEKEMPTGDSGRFQRYYQTNKGCMSWPLTIIFVKKLKYKRVILH